MGIGDELMLAGEARRQAAGRSVKFRMLNKRGQPHWHPVWEGNAHIARPDEPFDGEIGLHAGRRPYMAHVAPGRYTFQAYAPAPAQIQLTERARKLGEYARGSVVFNPTIKPQASPNKNWGLDSWKALVSIARDVRWIQVGDHAAPRVRGAELVHTNDFIDACGVLSGARAAVLHEGALHHAAAAFDLPTVVVAGGFISPQVTGYPGQRWLYRESAEWPLGCGMRTPCPHCADAMRSITPNEVRRALQSLLQVETA